MEKNSIANGLNGAMVGASQSADGMRQTAATLQQAKVCDMMNPEVFERLLGAIEVHNVPDEAEPQGLFRIGGVEVIPRQSVNIIAAQKKSGKTNFAGVLMAASASKEKQVLSGFVQCTQEAARVLVADTEQPLKDARRTLRRTMKTAGYDYDEQWRDHGISVLSFKEFDCFEEMEVEVDGQRQRVHLLWVMLEQTVKLRRPDLLVIDGLADLLRSVNDEAEARELMRWLDRLACTYDMAVVGMLHLNYNSGKIGGWAGTQAGKKFTDCFTLKKNREGGFFVVTHEGRGESAPKLRFRISCRPGDKFGWWEAVDDNDPALCAQDLKRQELITALEGAPLPCRNAVLVSWVMAKDHHPSESTANRFLCECRKQGILRSHKEGRYSVWARVTEADAEEELLELEE